MPTDRFPLQVTVYTEPGSAGCDQVKSFLRERDIAFIEKDIFQDITAGAELRQLVGKVTIPVVHFGNQLIVGFDLDELEKQFGADS